MAQVNLRLGWKLLTKLAKLSSLLLLQESCFHYVVDVTLVAGQVWFLDIEGKFVPRCDRRYRQA